MPSSRNQHRLALACTAGLTALSWVNPAAAAAAIGDGTEIIVYGRPDGYDLESTPTGTKTDTALIDVPQTINVVSREQIEDQGMLSLGEALRYVPGVVLGQGEGHRDQVTLRGQNSTADFFVDGIRDDAQYYRPLYNVERIEVLKGANALIFGRGGGGGAINRVSKAPEFAQLRGSLAGGIDSFGAWNLAADLGAGLGDDLGFRLDATYEQFDNHRQYFDGHFAGVTPSLGIHLGNDTRLTMTYEYAHDSRLTDRGVPSWAGLPLRDYDKTLFGSPQTNTSAVGAHLAHARLDHQFSGGLSANLIVHFADYAKFYSNVYAASAVSPSGMVTLGAYNSSIDRQNLIGQGNLVWKGRSGSIAHTLLLGFEAGDQDTLASRRNGVFASSPTVPLARIMTIPAVSFPALTSASNSQVRFWSGYVQDQIDIGEHIKLVGAVRLDRFTMTSLNRISLLQGRRADTKWSPRLGLILKGDESLSFYGSYSVSFLPQSGDQFAVLDATTQTLAPEQFENLELGFKWDITPGLALTGAAYRLDRSNTRASDPLSGNPVLTGASRTRGIELSLVGRITRKLDVSMGYALQDGKVTATTLAAPAGTRLAQVPRHQASAWARYDFTRRFGLGLGLIHQSGQFASISNQVRLPAFTRIDAALFLDVSDRIALQLNVENLTDTGYFPAAHSDNNITVGKPISAKLTARVKF